MISKIQKLAIERAASSMSRELMLIGAHRHFDEARDLARQDELRSRRWAKDCGIKFSRGYTVDLAASYWALKIMLELVTGDRELPTLGDTLYMSNTAVIGCQIFACHEEAVRRAFDELSDEHQDALLEFKHTEMSESVE
tara:strand:- start:985 stop:1401 length:417 start_codon:yes stop_codon:yes gene_type:complete